MPENRAFNRSMGRMAQEGVQAVVDMGFLAAATPVLARAPKGDGHTVVVLPGLGGDDRSTQPLRGFLRSRGYDVRGWGLGRNLGPDRETRVGLAEALRSAYARRREPVSLVGWSMGGVYARELAAAQPYAVRQVITLGSPVLGSIDVPSPSIITRRDAIVPWRRIVPPAGPQSENIEVRASHITLGQNPSVLYVVADRLAQPVGTWAPFAPSGPAARWFPSDAGRRSA